MITNKDYINDIKRGDGITNYLGFTLTERCNLRCAHCYMGKPRPVDIKKEVIDTAFQYFKKVRQINLYGAESQFFPKGIQYIKDSALENNVKVGRLSFITNLTFINKQFFKNLEELRKELCCDVGLEISNTEFHRESAEKLGYEHYNELINANRNKLRDLYPEFDKILVRPYLSKEEYLPTIRPYGRAATLEGAGYAKKLEDSIKMFQIKNGDKTAMNVIEMQIDTNGNVVQPYRDNQSRQTENFGNILQKPIPKILIEHGQII